MTESIKLPSRKTRNVLLVVFLLIVSAGCTAIVPTDSGSPKGTEADDTASRTEVATDGGMTDDDGSGSVMVRGTVLNSPTALEPPASTNPEYGSEGVWNYTAVLRVTTVERGPASLEDEIVLVHYSYYPQQRALEENFSTIKQGSVVEISGKYDGNHNLLTSANNGTNQPTLNLVGSDSDRPVVPIVGREGTVVGIETYRLVNGSSNVSTLSTDDTTIRVMNESTARVIEGSARLGDTFESADGSVIIEIRESR